MATSAGNQVRQKLGRLIRQSAGESVTIDNDGTITGQVVYKCDYKQALALAPRINKSTHPDFTGLLCSGIDIKKETPGIAVLTVTYGGLPVGENGNNGGGDSQEGIQSSLVTEVQTGTSQEPIETHKDFESVLAGTADNPKNDAKFKADGTFDKFGADSPYKGVTTYLVATATFRRNYIAGGRPDLDKAGKIDYPLGAPRLGNDENWLNMGASFRKQGNVYSVSEEWLKSGPNGWDAEIY